jgi:hypothetical protein
LLILTLDAHIELDLEGNVVETKTSKAQFGLNKIEWNESFTLKYAADMINIY